MKTWIKEPKRTESRPPVVRTAIVTERTDHSDSADPAEPKRKVLQDPVLAGLSLLAVAIGLVFIFDAGYARSVQTGKGMIPREFWMQILFAVAALGAAWLGARVPIHVWAKLAKPIWILNLLFLGGLMAPGVGHEMNGAVRWYRLGPITIQPAEFAKVAVVLYLAAVLAHRKAWPSNLKVPRSFAMKVDAVWIPKLVRALPLVWVLLACAMIELEPDLGTCFIVAAIAFAMLWAGGVTRRSLTWCAVLAGILVYGLVHFQPYRLERITTHLDRWNPSNVDGIAYQTVQSELAMASGGMFGVGMGAGRAKHVMPAATTDFISSTVAEEFGLFGWLAVVAVLGALTWRLLKLAIRAPTPFAKLVLCGFGAWIGGQTILNLLMANGTLPAIGIPLPFISSGGSSLVALGLAMGICQSALITAKAKKEDSVADDRDGWRDGRPRLSRA